MVCLQTWLAGRKIVQLCKQLFPLRRTISLLAKYVHFFFVFMQNQYDCLLKVALAHLQHSWVTKVLQHLAKHG